MRMQLISKWMMVGLVMLVLGFGVTAMAAEDSSWTGAGSDNLWDNPDNWLDGIVPGIPDVDGNVGNTLINGPAGEAPNGPLIQDGIAALTGIMSTEAGDPTLTMTGGTLELTGWGVWWGDGGDNHSVWNLSGGYVSFTTEGSNGVFEMGWQGSDDIAYWRKIRLDFL